MSDFPKTEFITREGEVEIDNCLLSPDNLEAVVLGKIREIGGPVIIKDDRLTFDSDRYTIGYRHSFASDSLVYFWRKK